MANEGWTTVAKKKNDEKRWDDKIQHNPNVYSNKFMENHSAKNFTVNTSNSSHFNKANSNPNFEIPKNNSNTFSPNYSFNPSKSFSPEKYSLKQPSPNLSNPSLPKKNSYYKNSYQNPYKNNYHSRGGNSLPPNIKKKSEPPSIKKNINPKRSPENIPDFNSPEEQEKFTKLKIDIPHLKMPGEIRREQLTINIDGLSDKMLSDECIELQRSGWEYVKVIKPDDESALPEGDNYEIISIDNKWGDFLLFSKK